MRDKVKRFKKPILAILCIMFLIFYVSPMMFYQTGGPIARYSSMDDAHKGRNSSISSEYESVYMFYIGIEDIEAKNYDGESLEVKKTPVPFIYSFEVDRRGLNIYTVEIGGRQYYYKFATT